eukprot:g4127.t1
MAGESLIVRRVRLIEHLVFAYVLFALYKRLRRRGLRNSLRDLLGVLLTNMRKVPGAAAVVEAEVEKEVNNIRKSMLGDGDPDAVQRLPAKGLSSDEVVALASKVKGKEEGLSTGKKWGGIYYDTSEGSKSELSQLQARMWGMYNSTNSLYPGVFPSVRKFEAEVVAMAVDLLNGPAAKPAGAVGLLTSGGTESILIAIHAYREKATELGIDAPELICCYTAHPAVDKACHYFGVKLVKVAAEPKTQQLAAPLAAKAINSNTIA